MQKRKWPLDFAVSPSVIAGLALLADLLFFFLRRPQPFRFVF